MRKYNVIRQEKDERDFMLKTDLLRELPNKIDLTDKCPPVFDQGKLGSCTAQAGVAARMMLGNIHDVLSRLFLYYKERELNGTQKTDSGATMRDICKALAQSGVCKEIFWPYIEKNFAIEPPLVADWDALLYRITSYRTFDSNNPLQELYMIKQYMAQRKQPVLAGIEVYASFETAQTAQTGIIPMPDVEKEPLLGGHAVLLVGYDEEKQWFIFRNSWGENWGNHGYGYMPYEYIIKDHAFDFWVIE